MTLDRLSRSLLVTGLALAALANTVACSYPTVRPRVAPELLDGRAGLGTIAVLPVDINIAIAGKAAHDPEVTRLRSLVLTRLHNGLLDALQRRGYRIQQVVEPDGGGFNADPKTGKRALLIHPNDLSTLRVQIHNRTAADVDEGTIVASVSADLTRQILRSTGADTSVYARGWAVRLPKTNDNTVAIILTVVAIVFIVGLIILALTSDGKAAKGVGEGVGKGASKAAKVAARIGMGSLRFAVRTAPYAAMAAADIAREHQHEEHHRAEHAHCFTCPPPPHEANGPPSHRRQAAAPVVYWAPENEVPGESTFALAVTFVQNASGKILWHGQQRFSLAIDRDTDLDALMEHFFKHLPPAASK